MSSKLIDTTWKGVPHFRTRSEVATSPAWRVMSFSAKALYTELRSKLRSNNNGNINATFSEMKHFGWASQATLATALYQLMAMGFIVKTRGGGVERGSKVCSLYAFTDLEVNAYPKAGIEARKATFDYRQYTSVAEAKRACKAGVERLRAESVARYESARKKTTIQKLNRDGAEIELVKPSIGAEIEPVKEMPVQKLNQSKRARTALQAAPMLASGP